MNGVRYSYTARMDKLTEDNRKKVEEKDVAYQ